MQSLSEDSEGRKSSICYDLRSFSAERWLFERSRPPAGKLVLIQNVKVTSLLKPKQEAGALQSSNSRRAVRGIVPQRGGGNKHGQKFPDNHPKLSG
ncbi:hypothetical protein CgunFtcFv8_001424 [Champsocephalus gunnari]|uniref:Uncharacterized protein n=1 Tax=Champsocephalus gunnari TaxID=52237 RepID=A0AAN8CJS7_CHAGU|nr:hypothetical protein CgunFtcFv8_001424 [Champsocephalus gunnari]